MTTAHVEITIEQDKFQTYDEMKAIEIAEDESWYAGLTKRRLADEWQGLAGVYSYTPREHTKDSLLTDILVIRHGRGAVERYYSS